MNTTDERTYFARVLIKNLIEFDSYIKNQEIKGTQIQESSVNGEASVLFSLIMDEHTALALRLSLSLNGFIIFD